METRSEGSALARLSRSSWIALAAVVLTTAVLYGTSLDDVPLHLHHDELLVGLAGHAVSESGRDPNGRLLPLYFQVGSSIHWYPPIVVYLTALFLTVLPLSEVAVRLPNVLVGVVNVVLLFFVARRLFRAEHLALLAAIMLALTPAHFMHSRIATDSLYQVAFTLGWLLGLLRHQEEPTAKRLLIATSLLGLGVYSYAGAVIMMPIYLVITLAALAWERRKIGAFAVAVLGFAWPLAFGALFLAFHSEFVDHLLVKYRLSEGGGPSLNPLQQIKEAFSYWNVSDKINSLHQSFAPGYLFVTGGSNIAHSTRQAGVFLAPAAIFLLGGIYDVVTRPTLPKMIVLAGFVTAPVAAIVVAEDFAITRMLGLLPFGVLLAALGVRRLWLAPVTRPVLPLPVAAGLVLCAIGLGYAAVTIFREGRISGAALLVALTGGLVILVAWQCHRRRTWAPVAASLILLMAVQFFMFSQDYFGAYAARSAARYGYNVGGAIEQMIGLHDRGGNVPLVLNEEIPYVKAYWEFYLTANRRPDLITKATIFDTRSDILGQFPRGSLFLTDASDRARAVLGGRGDFIEVGSSSDPIEGGEGSGATRTTFLIYQRQ